MTSVSFIILLQVLISCLHSICPELLLQFLLLEKKINTNISVVQTLRYGTFRQLSNMSDWFHLESKSPQNQMWTNPTIYFVTLLWNMSILHVLYMLGIILGLLSRTFAVFVHTLKCKMRKKALQAKTENKKKV